MYEPAPPVQSKYLYRQSLEIRVFSTMEGSEDIFTEEQLNITSVGNETSESETGEGTEHLRTVELFLGTDCD